ncbi:B-box zinc finger protein 32-like [Olea europaea var. sylvestris]|uniref:B-box zinc finger protein 32-like n=1 Tax=Olea europaea var. sylvestris TaxID=158386 RepID=UPI000C1D2DD6|nr:B-box zinc finger protein 32-like [Olea europaea var. sylvestris]
MKIRVCELCNADAAVYCRSDSAFLCWACDSKVHQANFLVARHVRRPICSECKGIIGESIPGLGFQPMCRCSPASAGNDLVSLSSSESSICVSSTTTKKNEYSGHREPCVFNSSSGNDNYGEFKSKYITRTQRGMIELKVKGIFVKWCALLGRSGDVPVQMASDALTICLNQWTVFPFRVCLAASMWFGLRFSGESTRQSMKRLEEISGVPAKLIAAAESKLERLLKVKRRQHRHQHQLVEGWGEC